MGNYLLPMEAKTSKQQFLKTAQQESWPYTNLKLSSIEELSYRLYGFFPSSTIFFLFQGFNLFYMKYYQLV